MGIAIASTWFNGFVFAFEKIEGNSKTIKPTYVVAPIYPRKAAMRKIEGFVSFKLNVDPKGNPYDIEIIDSDPAHIFDREAKRVISQWKFAPKIVDGVAVTQLDREYTIEYKMEGEKSSNLVSLAKQ